MRVDAAEQDQQISGVALLGESSKGYKARRSKLHANWLLQSIIVSIRIGDAPVTTVHDEWTWKVHPRTSGAPSV